VKKIFIPHIKEMMQLAVTDTQTHTRTYVYDRALYSSKNIKKTSIFRCLLFFTHESAAAHNANGSLLALRKLLDTRLIEKWPWNSPDQTPCHF